MATSKGRLPGIIGVCRTPLQLVTRRATGRDSCEALPSFPCQRPRKPRLRPPARLAALIFFTGATWPVEMSFSRCSAGGADRPKVVGGPQTHKGGRVRCEGEAVARKGGTQFLRGLVPPAFAGAFFERPSADALLFLSAERDHSKTGRTRGVSDGRRQLSWPPH